MDSPMSAAPSSPPHSPTNPARKKHAPAEATPLWRCLQENGGQGIGDLVRKGADVNVRDASFGWSPNLLVASRGSAHLVKLLVEARARLETTCHEGNTALMLASRGGHLRAAEYLVGAKADLDLQNNNGWTALAWSAINGHEDVAMTLIGARADYNKADKEGRTACMWAARHGQVGIVETLLAYGLSLSLQDAAGLTVMSHAQEHLELLSTIQALARVNEDLLSAARRGDAEAVRGAIEEGANLDPRDEEGWTPLMWAALHGSLDMVKLLVRHGANPRLLEESSGEPGGLEKHFAVGDALVSILGSNERFMSAAKEADWEAVDEELTIGAWINFCDETMKTALMWAGKHGAAVALESLVKKNAHLDARDFHGWTAVHCAISAKSIDAVSMLYFLGADFELATYEGDTLLHMAARNDDGVMLQLVIAAKANVEELDAGGRTALMIAAMNGIPISVRTLLAYGADVTATEPLDQRAPFALAVAGGHLGVVELMLDSPKPPRTIEPRSLSPKSPTSPSGRKRLQQRAAAKPKPAAQPAATRTTSIAARKTAAVRAEQHTRGDGPRGLVAVATAMREQAAKAPGEPKGRLVIKQTDKYSCTPLKLAVHYKRHAITARLMEEGADPHVADTQGVTVLMEAVITKQRDVVEKLLDQNVSASRENKEGQRAIDLCGDDIIRHMLNRYAIKDQLPEASEEERDFRLKETIEAADGDGEGPRSAPAAFRIRIEGLPTQLTAQLLEAQINSMMRSLDAPRPTRIDVAVDPVTSRPRGHAYADFADAAAVDLALRGDQGQLSGQEIRIFKDG